jgi:branched-chain amino acid transport system permease protein
MASVKRKERAFKPSILLSLSFLVCLAIGSPIFLPTFWVRILTGVFMWIALAQSWNIIGGYTGYINFGHGAFFGIGAYFTGLTMKLAGIPFFASIVLAGLVNSAVAFIIGLPTLRLRGAYFAIATWAFAEAIRHLASILKITGGSYGFRLPPFLDENFFYFSMLAAALFTMVTTYCLVDRSRFGLCLRAIRDAPEAAESLGINTTKEKLKAFVLSAFFPGMIGGIYAYWLTFIHPASVLSALITDQMVVMTLVGGVGTFWGPAVGAVVVQLANKLIWITFGAEVYYLILLGLAIGAVVLFMPEGIVGLISRVRSRSSIISVSSRQKGFDDNAAAN